MHNSEEYQHAVIDSLKRMQFDAAKPGWEPPDLGILTLIACLVEALGTSMVMLSPEAQDEIIKQLIAYNQTQRLNFAQLEAENAPKH